MFEKFSKYIPGISLLPVAALSVFNVAYFWRIGVHFLGTYLSNVVYSFGLATIVLGIVAWFIPGMVRRLSEPFSDRSVRKVVRSTYVLWAIAGTLGMFGQLACSKAPRRRGGAVAARPVADGKD